MSKSFLYLMLEFISFVNVTIPLLLLQYVTEINGIPGCSWSDQALKLYFIHVVGI